MRLYVTKLYRPAYQKLFQSANPCWRKTARWYACAARSLPGGPSQASAAASEAAAAAESSASRARGVVRGTAGTLRFPAAALLAHSRRPYVTPGIGGRSTIGWWRGVVGPET